MAETGIQKKIFTNLFLLSSILLSGFNLVPNNIFLFQSMLPGINRIV